MDLKDYEKYSKARNRARWECRKAKRTFERTLTKEAKRNPKAIYIFSYVNSKLKTKTGIADLDIETGKATTDSEKAEALNTFLVMRLLMRTKATLLDFTLKTPGSR